MADRWISPPGTIYTAAQAIGREEKRKAKLKARTVDRSLESVTEAVESLKRLIALPERHDMILCLGWEIKDNGEIDKLEIRNGAAYGERWNPRAKVIPTARRRVFPSEVEPYGLKLGPDGLSYWVARCERDGTDPWVHWWHSVEEDEFPYIVCRFQLFKTQLDFLAEALQFSI